MGTSCSTPVKTEAGQKCAEQLGSFEDNIAYIMGVDWKSGDDPLVTQWSLIVYLRNTDDGIRSSLERIVEKWRMYSVEISMGDFSYTGSMIALRNSIRNIAQEAHVRIADPTVYTYNLGCNIPADVISDTFIALKLLADK